MQMLEFSTLYITALKQKGLVFVYVLVKKNIKINYALSNIRTAQGFTKHLLL